MAQYAIAFDLDTKSMRADGFSKSDITNVYQVEIPNALSSCGFTVHAQGSLYHTDENQNSITAVMILQSTLRVHAPSFCRYVKRVHVFRMEEWSDVTELIVNRPAAIGIDAELELEEAEFENELESGMDECGHCRHIRDNHKNGRGKCNDDGGQCSCDEFAEYTAFKAKL